MQMRQNTLLVGHVIPLPLRKMEKTYGNGMAISSKCQW